jgi:hypothetical protein
MYKTSKYEYSTSSNGGNGYNSIDRSSGNNYNEINKLDTLLNDLEHERTATLDRSESNDRIESANDFWGALDDGKWERGFA